MAIFLVGEIEINQQCSDNLGVKIYSHSLLFKTARTDTPFQIYADANCPDIGAVHPSDTAAVCHSRSVSSVVRFRDSAGVIGLQWIIKLTYSTEVTFFENPLNEPALIWWTGEQYQKPAEFNRTGDVIVNKANTPVKGLVVQQTRPIINIRKNVSTSAIGLITDGTTVDHVNSLAFTIDGNTIGINFCKYKFIGLSIDKIRNGVAYRTFDFQFHLRADEWKVHFPNEGLYQKNLINPTVTGPWPTVDGTGAQGTIPLPLDINGTQLASTDPADVITLDEDVYDEIDFNTFSSYWT